MVNKFVTSQAAVADHNLSVNSISKKICDKKSYRDSKAKVLKPKVYILRDSSTFRNLVQELTGNGNTGCTNASDSTSASLSSSSDTTFTPVGHEMVPILQNNMMYASEYYCFQEMSPVGAISIPGVSDFSPCAIISNPIIDHEQDSFIGNNMMYNIGDFGNFQESSTEVSFDSSDHLIRTPVTSDFSEEIVDYMPTTFEDDEFQASWNMMSYPQYEETETWFSEIESCVYNNHGSNWFQPPGMAAEVCAFDCDLSAIIS
ncbi:hypothetical protein DCAR_0311081 [Daucus carota subsp. sativus]|uniref:VQ domain-containing protein n=1 Tax=Daucus carota subsp. sativus TaxID=79200 RepID=A0A166ACS9_DAUCS|nr:hypothetical protein DCAR_0311081 [Daucus carota subsp. sativus]